MLAAMEELGVKSVLEIGTGSGGLAKFFAEVMGYRTVTIEKTYFPAGWQSEKVEYIHDDSQTHDFGRRRFDLVFIDGDHSYDGVKADYELAKRLAKKAIALHDILGSGNTDVERFWVEIAKDVNGHTQPGFFESRNGDLTAAPGTGWIVLDQSGDLDEETPEEDPITEVNGLPFADPTQVGEPEEAPDDPEIGEEMMDVSSEPLVDDTAAGKKNPTPKTTTEKKRVGKSKS